MARQWLFAGVRVQVFILTNATPLIKKPYRIFPLDLRLRYRQQWLPIVPKLPRFAANSYFLSMVRIDIFASVNPDSLRLVKGLSRLQLN